MMSASSEQTYRATKLWNDIIHTFCNGVTLGRHRRMMKIYDDCFVASEAIDWLHQELKSNVNFGPHVTRSSALQLLQKFFKCNVFKDVRGSKYNREEFGDNNRLYRFCRSSPKKSLVRPPLAPRNLKVEENTLSKVVGPLKPQMPSGKHHISAQQIEDVWRNMLFNRLASILKVVKIDDIFDVDYVNTQNIIHNMTHLNSSGLVTNINKQDQLPPWVLHAMKCLAQWPEKIDDRVAYYPGFEKDVFNVVKSYFAGLEEPLITFNMYHIFTEVYVRAENIQRHSSCSSYRSVEKLMLNLTVQDQQQALASLHTTSASLIAHQTAPLPHMSFSQRHSYSTTSEASLGMEHAMAHGYMYPTASENVYSEGKNSESNCHSSLWSIDSRSVNEAKLSHRCQSLTDINNVEFPENELSKQRVESWEEIHIQQAGDAEEELDTLNYGFTVALSTTPYKEETDHNYCHQQVTLDIGRPPPPYKPPPHYVSSSNKSRTQEYESPAVPRPLTRNTEISKSRTSLTESYRLAMQGHHGQEATPVGKELFPNLRRTESSPSVFSPVSKTRIQDALQMCCLLMPPANRRKLHLLLRLMWRMSHNQELIISRSISTKQLVLETFSQSILCCENVSGDELLVQDMVDFMMEHHQDIMAVPVDLKQQITEKINHLQQVRCMLLDASSLAYCEQVTVRQYEEQRLSSSQKALCELLDNIIHNTNLPAKDRKKKLKQFQKSHPDIYARHFPVSRSESHLADNKPRIKQPLLTKPLRKLKSMKSIRL